MEKSAGEAREQGAGERERGGRSLGGVLIHQARERERERAGVRRRRVGAAVSVATEKKLQEEDGEIAENPLPASFSSFSVFL